MPRSDADEARVGNAMGIDDAYRVERVLASGPRGTTELVTINGSGPFVRKRIPRKMANRVVWAMLSECACPRLPQVQTTFETPDEFVVVYDFVEGDTLAHLVEQRGRLTMGEALPILHEVCEAVAALHAHGIVHRDLTPTNVILAEDGAHLVDLGIARFVGGPAADGDEAPLGTWGFAAPEQHGFAHTDARSDIYSLGKVLAFTLTGVMPRSEGSDRAIADEWLVPPAIACVINKACDFEPSARYQSVTEFVRALDAACSSHEAAARSAGTQPELPDSSLTQDAASPGVTRRRRVALVVALVMLVIVVVLAWCWSGWSASTDERSVPGEQTMAGDFAASEDATTREDAASSADVTPDEDIAPSEGVAPSASLASDIADLTASADSSQTDIAAGAGAAIESSTAADARTSVERSAATDASASAEPSVAADAKVAADASAAAEASATALTSAAAEGGSTSQGVAFPSGRSLVEQAVESLEIVETGHGPSSSLGFMTVVVGIRNTSDDLLVELPVVRVTGRSAEGTIVSNYEMGAGLILPGQTIYMAWPIRADQTPDELEFSLVEPQDYNVSHWDAGTPTYVLDNVAEVQSRDGVNFTGEVTLSGDLSVLQAIPYIMGLRVVVILRDGEGNAIGGRDTSLAVPSEGETVPFSIDIFDSPPDYESYEVYAYLV